MHRIESELVSDSAAGEAGGEAGFDAEEALEDGPLALLDAHRQALARLLASDAHQ